ncbi:hypothetical protein AHAS_Ahas05G0233500 [Arachis hypogaea]
MFPLFSSSPVKLRYALQMPKLFPYSVPHSTLRLCFPSTSSLHSHSHPQSLDEAVDSFTRMLSMRPPPSIIQFTKILGSLAKTNHFPTAISLFQQLQARGITPNLFTLSIVINCCCGMGRMALAFSVLAKIFRMGFQPDTVTLNTLIKGLCLGGKVEKALHLHERMLDQGFRFNEVTYGTLINGLCKTGHTAAAIQVLRKIPLYGIVPNVVMYSSIIDSLCKDTLVSEAIHLYLEMLAKGISPDVITYTTIVDGLCLVGQLKEAIDLLNHMMLKNIIPNVCTYSTLIDGLCKKGRIKDAENVFAIMIKKGVKPEVVIYNSLMDGYCLVNEVDKAKYVFSTMAQSRVSPDVWSYNIMINGLCKSKLVDDALNIFEDMCCKNLFPDLVTYNTLIDGLLKSRRIDDALELLQKMHDEGHHSADLVTFNTLIDGLCKNGRIKDAKEIFEHPSTKVYNLDTWTYNIMIGAFCKEGLLDEALSYLSKMKDNGCLPDVVTYGITISALLEKGEKIKAEKLVHEMISKDAKHSESLWTCICDPNGFSKLAFHRFALLSTVSFFLLAWSEKWVKSKRVEVTSGKCCSSILTHFAHSRFVELLTVSIVEGDYEEHGQPDAMTKLVDFQDKLRERERELRKGRKEKSMKWKGYVDLEMLVPYQALAQHGHRVMVVAPRCDNYTEGQDTGDMEVLYFQAYTDGVDFVFIDNPILSHIENNIYGENRVLSWTESKHKLENDPQGHPTNPDLDPADTEKIFRFLVCKRVCLLYESLTRFVYSLLPRVTFRFIHNNREELEISTETAIPSGYGVPVTHRGDGAGAKIGTDYGWWGRGHVTASHEEPLPSLRANALFNSLHSSLAKVLKIESIIEPL